MTTAERRPTSPAVADAVLRPTEHSAPEVDALVHDRIGRIADKWTLIVLEVLAEHGEVRCTRLGELVGAISPKMLT